MEYLYVALGLAALIGLYVWSYSANEKCEKPDGVEETSCTSCNAHSCSARKNEFKH